MTEPARIQPPAPPGAWANFWQSAKISFEQLSGWAKSFRVQRIVPQELFRPHVVMRNFEASYDNSHLKPLADRIPALRVFPFARRKALLQEYFIPREQLPEFIAKMKEIFLRYNVNVSNVSLRHVPANNESMLSWSKVDSFAVVVYYTQMYGRDRSGRLESAREWTREMIAEVERVGGSFYLPYQIYATRDQFNRAYPRHQEFFGLKKQLDPRTKFSNALWDHYRLSRDTYHYMAMLATEEGVEELRKYFSNIFSINNPEYFINAIRRASEITQEKGRELNDRNIYDELLRILPYFANGAVSKAIATIKALRVQQIEMARQTADALKEVGVQRVNGYVEIGSPGRYVLPLREQLPVASPVYVVNDSFGAANWVETSFGYKVPAVASSKKILFSDYDQFRQSEIPNESVDLATMFIGLHHCPRSKLHSFVASINRVLRVGGHFVLRDHQANERLLAMAFLAHSTYNAGLGLPYETELAEVRNLQPLEYWVQLMEQAGFKKVGTNRLQDGDPTGNTLMVFEKVQRTPELEDSIRRSLGEQSPGLNLNVLPGYYRAQSNTYMTQAEWFLVDIFKELSKFTEKTPWYQFPFERFTSLYGQVYGTTREFARREGLRDTKAFQQYDEMDQSLMSGIQVLFRAMKFAAKRVEKKSEGMAERDVVVEQTPLSQFFASYAEFMTHTPWYRFPHRRTLKDFEAQYRMKRGTPSAATRSLYFQMRVLFSAMDFAAGLVRWGLREESVVPTTSFLLSLNEEVPSQLTDQESLELTRLTNNLYLGTTGRYMPFTRVMQSLAGTDAQVVQVAGNEHISILLKSPSEAMSGISEPFDLIMTYQYPTATLVGGETAYHHMIRIRVSQLPSLLQQAQASGLEVVRVHDY